MTASGDLAAVRREGRIVALQTSLALAVMLVLVGAIVGTVYIRSQNAQIAAEQDGRDGCRRCQRSTARNGSVGTELMTARSRSAKAAGRGCRCCLARQG